MSGFHQLHTGHRLTKYRIVNDYFSQAAIDFFLGNVTSLVFEDFEANLMTDDPAVSMQKMRQQAIEMSQRLVVADDQEEFVGGWALLTPHVSNTIKSLPFEESVLLLVSLSHFGNVLSLLDEIPLHFK
jgi:hypothetical protein